jgi:DUF971 family protein
MKPLDIQPIGQELAIRWDESSESYIPLEKLRRACPCAGCKGETDIMGQRHRGPKVPLPANAFELRGMKQVGGYGVQPIWADGHSTGIYSFEYLRELSGGP